jgi:hypothetical protein
MSTRTIFKVQRPLGQADGPWLIYTRDREAMWTIDAEDVPDSVRKAMAKDHKAYFAGVYAGDTIALNRRVEEQPW